MTNPMRRSLCLAGMAAVLAPGFARAAEAGVSDKEIVLGQIIALTGPLAGITFATACGLVVAGHRRWAWPALSGGLALVLLAALERRDGIRLGAAWSHPLVSPLAHAAFALIMVNSWYWHAVLGTVWWRGRSYRYHHDEVGA